MCSKESWLNAAGLFTGFLGGILDFHRLYPVLMVWSGEMLINASLVHCKKQKMTMV